MAEDIRKRWSPECIIIIRQHDIRKRAEKTSLHIPVENLTH